MPSTESALASLRRRFDYFNWLYNPFQRLDARWVYDLLGTDVATERALYLNLGYWNGAETLDDACDALAALVGDAAGLGPGDRVLDVGFGFGDQDLFWMRRYGPESIVGLNVTASQVEVARARVRSAGAEGRIDLRLGSATQMPLEDASVDKVLALECAFHFDTREAFFREASRVLRPGGRLVLADILPMPPEPGRPGRIVQWLSWQQVARKFAIPRANAYLAGRYCELLERSGFTSIRLESIRDRIYAPLHRYLIQHPETARRLHPSTRLAVAIALKLDAHDVYRGLDYVLAVADKAA